MRQVLQALCVIGACAFHLLVSPAAARDNGQILQGILGGVAGEIERQQQIKRDKQLRQQFEHLWRACDARDVSACNAALQFQLNPDSVRSVLRMKDKAERWPRFETDWHKCARPDPDLVACDSALAFPYLNADNQSKLIAWRTMAVEEQNRRREQAEREQREIGTAEREAERQRQLSENEQHERQAALERAQSQRQQAAPIMTASVAVVRVSPAPTVGIVQITLVVIGLITLAGAALAAQIFWWAPVGATSPPNFDAPAIAAKSLPPLTGHFPTDVRSILAS